MKAIDWRTANTRRFASAAIACALASVSAAQGSYRIGEDSASADAGPVRMARFDYVSSGVDFRPASNVGWSDAVRNLPMRQGAQIYAQGSSRGEVQFDDGSTMRVGGGAVATLVTMYSDSQGEFTEVKLSNGLATFHLKNPRSLYQIDTPTGSIKSYGPAYFRVGDSNGLELANRAGTVNVSSRYGTTVLRPHQYVNWANSYSAPVSQLPQDDNWDRWNENRDEVVYHNNQYVPSNINLVTDDLDTYGGWRDDPSYGHVWYPHESSGWRPYSAGRWVYEDPYGWTWVGREDWGYAPYHYGTWIHSGNGWGWCPGPARQCWSPAVVHYCNYGDNVAWVPLAPSEVHYSSPGLSIGVGVGSLFLSFSIGSAGCYYPVSGGYCEPRPYNNVYVNRVTNVYNTTYINNNYYNSNIHQAWGVHNFSPRNAQYGGATYAATNSFGRGGSFQALPAGRSNVFRQGRSFGMPGHGANPVSGPFNVRPVATSFVPSHHFGGGAPSASILSRPVYRASVPQFAARHSVSVGNTLKPSATNHFARNVAIGAGAVAATAAARAAYNRAHNRQPITPNRGGIFGGNAAAARAAQARHQLSSGGVRTMRTGSVPPHAAVTNRAHSAPTHGSFFRRPSPARTATRPATSRPS